MSSVPSGLLALRNKWRAKTPLDGSPLPDVTDASRKAAMGNIVANVNVDEPPLRELNNALRVLVEVFPSVQPDVFREMLLNTSEQSRLQVVTENLLRDEARCVRGRVRVKELGSLGPQSSYSPGEDACATALSTEDRFRSSSYKAAVTDALSQEFKGLSRSSIRAVLAECNYSYTKARPTLLELSSKSWRFSITRLVFRRKAPGVIDHPLVTWDSTTAGQTPSPQPKLHFTPSTELNLELWTTLIQPVLEKQRAEQELRDWEHATALNEQQAEESQEVYECGCCFTSYPMEQFSNCTDQCHLICHRCVQLATKEALFGQGWARSIDHERGTLRCIASGGQSDVRCQGFIPSSMVQQALGHGSEGRDLWTRASDRCASEALLKSQLPLLRCPFCSYCELEDFDIRRIRWKWRLGPTLLALACMAMVCILIKSSYAWQVVQPFVILGCTILAVQAFLSGVTPPTNAFRASLRRIVRKRRGLRFTCQSPQCRRASCLNCRKGWSDIHVCFESSRLALRAAIEAATTDVVKRTCPVCSLSFVKEAGCNKLTCVCGYTMCYVCRQEIRRESYSHFCQHFRQRPGEPCHECEKCDLYKVEDEDDLVREAALRAEKEWWQQEERSGKEGKMPLDERIQRDQWNALEEETLPLTSAGRAHTALRALGSRARWERVLDKILGDFVE